ncbi:MAG: bile acid:sodium symporter [Planctomycetes bacterium]|nr:bile acid:sodium symporter [Planctomycetota bacterium]
MTLHQLIHLLVILSLSGLLLAIGLRLTAVQVLEALRGGRLLLRILAVNFVLVPALVLGLARLLEVPRDAAVAMVLLAAAPFAPVVPIFTRLAGGDLALAAGLTAVFPVISTLLTPGVCEWGVKALPEAGPLQFHWLSTLLILLATTTLPLAAGMAIHRFAATFGRKVLQPVEAASEAMGALLLALIVASEFRELLAVGWRALLAMVLGFELSLLLGHALGGPSPGSRRVAALGASNRNIAMALLIALESFAGTPIVSGVAANGLLMILLGLFQVAVWRFLPRLQRSRE